MTSLWMWQEPGLDSYYYQEYSYSPLYDVTGHHCIGCVAETWPPKQSTYHLNKNGKICYNEWNGKQWIEVRNQ